MIIFIKKDAFFRIKSRNKTLETRKYSGIFKKIKIDNNITFVNNNNKINANICNINIFDNINLLISNLDISKVGVASTEFYLILLQKCYSNFNGKLITFEFKLI
tara:strand:- start:347 stop:658 length:312 start_codon:yes stop_codon:yes gene_type:complete